MKRLWSTLVLRRTWPPLQKEFEHHLLAALVKFSPGQQLVLNGLFTPPSWVLRGTGIAALPQKRMASSHLLPATHPSGSHLDSVTSCLLLINRFVSFGKAELDQLTSVTKMQRQGLTSGTCCWTGSAHLVSSHCGGSFTPSELVSV